MKRNTNKSLSAQISSRSKKKESKKAYEGNTELMISTGSTLLDLAISGTRKRGGGVPGGILLEAFGPEGSGKTVLLCELGGAIQRAGGDVRFDDPEARLNKAFASMFDLDTDTLEIGKPDTVTQMIDGVKSWEPSGKGKIHGCMTDSLAALSTNMEMDNEEGDKMGMRRAKEFSEGLRKICRIITEKNYIMACSNQIRVNAGASAYGEQFTVPGGKAIAFYASVRLRFHKPEKVKKKKSVAGKEVTKVIGTKVKVEVYKNSVDAPYRTADLYIQFDYGIDDIRANLQYLKDYTTASVYAVNDIILDKSIEKSIQMVERGNIEEELKEAVIDLWEDIQSKFETNRQKKKR
jgi:recombination protein RecA